MNIKGVLPPNIPTNPVRTVDKVRGSIKSDETHDREANGQQLFDQNKGDQQKREPMSPEQFVHFIEKLKHLSSIKEHNWSIDVEVSHGKKFALVKDAEGHVIRRIPESELWTLPMDNDLATGQLLRKTG